MGLPFDQKCFFSIWGIAHKFQEATLTCIMNRMRLFHKCLFLLAWLTTAQVSFAMENDKLDQLFNDLAGANADEVSLIEQNIMTEFARSGSDAMDLLLERGRDALAAGDSVLAVEHLTALIDHAPNFAEGYNTRATAYFTMGYYGLAMNDIAQTLALEPRHFGALSGMAQIFAELDRPATARKVLLQIQQINPQMQGLLPRIEQLDLALNGAAL
jgi:tetratricopeptide (TPR) repeat protein